MEVNAQNGLSLTASHYFASKRVKIFLFSITSRRLILKRER